MTITSISRRAILFGIAVIIALSLLALTLAALHGIPTFGIAHASAHVVTHGHTLGAIVRFHNSHLLADGGFPAPPLCPPDACPA